MINSSFSRAIRCPVSHAVCPACRWLIMVRVCTQRKARRAVKVVCIVQVFAYLVTYTLECGAPLLRRLKDANRGAPCGWRTTPKAHDSQEIPTQSVHLLVALAKHGPTRHAVRRTMRRRYHTDYNRILQHLLAGSTQRHFSVFEHSQIPSRSPEPACCVCRCIEEGWYSGGYR